MNNIRILRQKNIGFMKLRVTCSSIEKFLNLLWNKNIIAKNIRYIDRYTIFVTIKIKDYNEFKNSAKRVNARYKVVGGDKTFTIINKLKSRKVIFSFPIIFAIILYLLSQRIWIINISTETHLAPFEVREILRNIGITPGINKRQINVYNLQEELINKNSNISWVKARVDGSILNISIAEKQTPPKIEEISEDGNVIAKKDGVISRLYSIAGTCVVKPGDTVKKGQVLIEGIQGKEGSTYNIEGKGIVFAKTFYEKTKRINFNVTEKKYTGEEKKDIYIKIGNKSIYLKRSANNFKKYDKIYSNNHVFNIVTYKEYTEENKKINSEEAINKAIEELTKEILSNIDKNVKVVDKIIEKNPVKDGCDLRLVIVGEEDIASDN